MNRTKLLKSEIVAIELLPEIIRCVLGNLPEANIAAIVSGMVSLRKEHPGLRLIWARTLDTDGNMIAAAYLCEYPGALGVLVGPWTNPSRSLSNGDVEIDACNSVEEAAVSVLKLLLDASKDWQVELIQSLDHRNGEPKSEETSARTSKSISEASTSEAISNKANSSDRNDLLRQRLEASGMQWLTTLQHLDLLIDSDLLLDTYQPSSTLMNGELAPTYSWTRFRWQDASRWTDWLDGTYIDSMDCPELNGIRSTLMTLQGYWALTGVPTLPSFLDEDDSEENDLGYENSPASLKESSIEWWGLRSLHPKATSRTDRDSHGNLTRTSLDGPIEAGFMLSKTSSDSWELTYMGVHYAYRGNQLGKACLTKAIERVARWHGTRLSLAVDIRNHVCESLYNTFGFQPVSEIDAWIYSQSIADSRKS